MIHQMRTVPIRGEFALMCTCTPAGSLFVGSKDACARNMVQHQEMAARERDAARGKCTHRCMQGRNCGGCGCAGCGYATGRDAMVPFVTVPAEPAPLPAEPSPLATLADSIKVREIRDAIITADITVRDNADGRVLSNHEVAEVIYTQMAANRAQADREEVLRAQRHGEDKK